MRKAPMTLRLLLLAVVLATPASALAEPGPCATPHLMPSFVPPRVFPALAAGAREKDSRNPYGVPNELLTESFAVRWGNNWQANQAGLQTLAEALEDAWQTQIVDLDHPAPPSADATRVNVYIGDSGNGTPSAFGAGGYFSQDEEGFPMMVINQASLETPAWTRVVALHEFYHSVQWGLGSYSYDESSPGAWYWEATASWVPSVTDPESPANGTFLFGYALLPHLELDAFDYPDSGALDEYHQYGAFIFPTFLVEAGFAPELIRDTWVTPAGGTGDPIEALRARLADEGADFDALFTEFVAANAFWDYTHGDYWEQVVLSGQQSYPNADFVTAWIDGEGTNGFESAPVNRKPRRYGANILRLDDLDDGEWLLRARFDDEGNQGSPASFGAMLVREALDGGIDYQRVSSEELDVGVTVEPSGSQAVALVVTASSVERRPGERFDWDWSIEPIVTQDDDDAANDDDTANDDDDDAASDDDDGPRGGFGGGGAGCGCSSIDAPGGGLAAVLLLLYGIAAPRLRRRSAASSRRVPSGYSAAKST
ncbi:MAG: hypothetical protein KDA24_22695 [Deltaproteobacteria bacterium]|nr:hypothetical protein [Deltaproteobacteria bacterium]